MSTPYSTLVYGDRATWQPFLDAWLDRYSQHIGEPLTIATDETSHSWVGEYSRCAEIMVVPPADIPAYKRPLNLSGILLAHLAIHAAPTLVITLDCEIMRPITRDEQASYQWADIALGLDPIPRHWPQYGVPTEYNCAVQWCGQPWIGHRFLDLWSRLGGCSDASTCPFFEQVVWSRVFWSAEPSHRTIYPRALNWSHLWGRTDTTGNHPAIIHHHGTAAKRAYSARISTSTPVQP